MYFPPQRQGGEVLTPPYPVCCHSASLQKQETCRLPVCEFPTAPTLSPEPPLAVLLSWDSEHIDPRVSAERVAIKLQSQPIRHRGTGDVNLWPPISTLSTHKARLYLPGRAATVLSLNTQAFSSY